MNFAERITRFLLDYVDVASEGFEPDGTLKRAVSKVACRQLINDGVFTVETMRKTALERYRVIIPWDYFEGDGV